MAKFSSVLEILMFLQMSWLYAASSPTVMTNASAGALMEELIKLHLNYCGYRPLCSVEDSSLEAEPEMSAFSTPCCQPCSCLPICASRGNCCPDFHAYFQNRSSQEKSNLPATQEITSQKGKETLIRNAPDGVQQLHQGVDRKLDNCTERMQNLTDCKMEDDDIANLITNAKQTANDAVATCVRPQVLYNTGLAPDAQAYQMVTSCPDGYQNISTVQKCSNSSINENLFDIIPVTSALTQTTYVNKHCLWCNERAGVKESWISVWKPVLVEGYRILVNHFKENPQSILNSLNEFSNRNIHFVPLNSTIQYVTPCQAFDVSSCNLTGLWNVYDNQIESVCKLGLDLPVVAQISGIRKAYKNAACVLCNQSPNNKDRNKSCAFYRLPSNFKFYKLVINDRPFEDEYVLQWTGQLARSFNATIAKNVVTQICGSGYVRIMGRCRQVLCPRDHYMENGVCYPLYTELTGLGVCFKIKVTPSRALQKDERSEFTSKLKQIFDESMANTITLKTCHVSLLFSPKLKANKENYIFSSYLRGQPVLIFYEILQQVHDFYKTLTGHRQLIFTNESIIELNYSFGHNIQELKNRRFMDLATGQFLRYQMGDRLVPEPCRSCKVISDRNWCYQTVFHISELNYPIMKSQVSFVDTGRVLYTDAYDWLDNEHMVTCLDTFVDGGDDDERLDKHSDDGKTDGDEEKGTDISKKQAVETQDNIQSDNFWFTTGALLVLWTSLGLIIFFPVLRKGLHMLLKRRDQPT